MHITHCTRSQFLVEMTSTSSQFRNGSSGDSSQFPHTKEEGGPGGDELEDELMFDVDANLEVDNVARLSNGTCRCLAVMLGACPRISKFGSSNVVKKGMPLMCMWLENESILRELPKVSEVSTNHWVYF